MLTWVLGGVTVVLAICGGRYHGKYIALKKQYDKKMQDLTNALEEAGRVKLLNEYLAKEKDIMVKQVNDLQSRVRVCDEEMKNKRAEIKSWLDALDDLQFNAFKHLCVMEERYPATVLHPSTNKRAVSVAIKHPKFPKNFILVKDFWYDKMDEADYEFAKSEAKELLEIIQKF